ncbi:MAG TPA: tetratricopeptide repeat protein [Xanthomonadaceae bacterium]|nr:tetratricopeptide repeat protein [Xanthomonadaceae bacterium]
MDELLDEKEQGERVLAWLRNNGAALIAGVVLGLGAIFGWKWWQQQELEQRVAAGQAYQETVESIEAGDPATAAPLVAGLDEAPYETLAALRLAQAQVGAGQADAAIATLQGVSAEDPALAYIVQLRLARLLVHAGKAEEALALLADATQPATLELRGDAEAALGRRDAARAAYEQALAALDEGSPQRQLIEIKLVAVGGTPPNSNPGNPHR